MLGLGLGSGGLRVTLLTMALLTMALLTMAVRTMALLTMALLTMALLTMALLTMALLTTDPLDHHRSTIAWLYLQGDAAHAAMRLCAGVGIRGSLQAPLR